MFLLQDVLCNLFVLLIGAAVGELLVSLFSSTSIVFTLPVAFLGIILFKLAAIMFENWIYQS